MCVFLLNDDGGGLFCASPSLYAVCLESKFQNILPCLAVAYAVAWMGDRGPIEPYIDDTLMMVPRPRRGPRSLLLGRSGVYRQQ